MLLVSSRSRKFPGMWRLGSNGLSGSSWRIGRLASISRELDLCRKQVMSLVLAGLDTHKRCKRVLQRHSSMVMYRPPATASDQYALLKMGASSTIVIFCRRSYQTVATRVTCNGLVMRPGMFDNWEHAGT